ncbi:MAG: glycoside hydrolase family 88 protein [Clostridia bacterium]|nr:glycoside hydrolase family 88 protein [Clostridia bacterium]
MKNLIEKAADRMISIGSDGFSEKCPISIIDINKWEWAQGVGLYGLYRYWSFSGERRYFDFLINWFNSRIEEGLPEKNVNTCAPMLTLTYLYEKTKNEEWLEIIKEWSQWIYHDFPRTGDMGIQHITTGIENKGQLWADTLFMTNLFLARAGMLLGNEDYINESQRQFLVHIKYLFDKTCGLWFHGWSFLRMDNFSAVHWGRGNCWYTAGVVDYIDMVPLEPTIKEYLIATLKSQADALVKYQGKNGMWKTIIDDPTSYDETSATAGFCYGLLKAVRRGYLDESYLECATAALDAVCKRIGEDGTVLEVSYGTPVFDTPEEYKAVELCPMTYGQALAVLCLTEGMQIKTVKYA